MTASAIPNLQSAMGTFPDLLETIVAATRRIVEVRQAAVSMADCGLGIAEAVIDRPPG